MKKEKIVASAGKDGVTIKRLCVRLLEAHISIKATSATFVVAYSPTEDGKEGEKANSMSVLNNTVVPVPKRKHEYQSGKKKQGSGALTIAMCSRVVKM